MLLSIKLIFLSNERLGEDMSSNHWYIWFLGKFPYYRFPEFACVKTRWQCASTSHCRSDEVARLISDRIIIIPNPYEHPFERKDMPRTFGLCYKPSARSTSRSHTS